MIALQATPLDITKIVQEAQSLEAGGVVIFLGTVRSQTQGKKVLYLEYEAYEGMALKSLEKIFEEVMLRWQLKKLSLVHRVGRVEVGEPAVVVVAAAPHRKEAFNAASYAIDAIKTTSPIWKKEVFADGAVWVAGCDSHEKEERVLS